MKKCCIIGAFGFSDLEKATGGQPVKTRTLFDLLTEAYGAERITYVETYQWRKHPITMLIQLFASILTSDALIMLPAQNGILVFSGLILRFKRKRTRLYYDVIGGWLPDVASKNTKLLDNLRKLDGIWVETSSMKIALEDLGLDNVSVVPNFKMLEIVSPEDMPYCIQEPFLLCTFSRVMEEKGITDAISAVLQINSDQNRTVYTLDIYGPVDPRYEEEFYDMLKCCPETIRYKGVVPPGDSVDTLKYYFALLFPTRYYTEGVPGTIIDAYAAGLPVIASKWESFNDVIDQDVTGYGYRFADVEELTDLLTRIAKDPEMVTSLKKNCIDKAKYYLPKNSIENIKKMIEEKAVRGA